LRALSCKKQSDFVSHLAVVNAPRYRLRADFRGWGTQAASLWQSAVARIGLEIAIHFWRRFAASCRELPGRGQRYEVSEKGQRVVLNLEISNPN